MGIAEKVEQVVESGIEPICLVYETVRSFDDSPGIQRTFLQINSLDLGALTYRQYRFVARRSKHGDQLVQRHITKLMRYIQSTPQEEHHAISCYTVPVYARLLRDGVLAKMLFDGFAQFPQVAPSQICIELSADILYEDLEMAKAAIDELMTLGVKIAIGEVGDEYCPVFRLAALPFQYAFLDVFSTDRLTTDAAERVVGGLTTYLHSLHVRVIAPELKNEAQVEQARLLGCDGYTLLSKKEEGV